MSYENNEEFRDYVPHTNDPGDLVLFGTIGICVGLLLVAHLLISVVQRRQKRRRADREARARLEEAAIREASENFAASDLLPDAEAVFERRVFKKDGRRLKGWNEIVTSIEENQERPPGKVPPDAAEMLQRDLFEDGGVVDQLNGYMSKETTIRESPDDAMSDATAESSVAGSEYVLMHGQQPQERAVGTCRYLFSLLRPDRELRKLLKLAIPYSVSSLLESVFDILTLALIGRLLGTRELSAYVMSTSSWFYLSCSVLLCAHFSTQSLCFYSLLRRRCGNDVFRRPLVIAHKLVRAGYWQRQVQSCGSICTNIRPLV